VVPFRFLDGFKVGCPGGPRGGQERGVVAVLLRGAERRIIGSSEDRQEVRPPGLRPVRHPLKRSVHGELGCYPVKVGLKPYVQRPGGWDWGRRRNNRGF